MINPDLIKMPGEVPGLNTIQIGPLFIQILRNKGLHKTAEFRIQITHPLIFYFSCFYAYLRIGQVKLGLGLSRRVRKEVKLGPCRVIAPVRG